MERIPRSVASNRSLRAALAVLVVGVSITGVLLAIALVQPTAAAPHDGHPVLETGSGSTGKVDFAWVSLRRSIEDLEKDLEEIDQKRDSGERAHRESINDLASRFESQRGDDADAIVERTLADRRLLGKIESAVAGNDRHKQVQALSTSLDRLVERFDDQARAQGELARDLESLQPELEVAVVDGGSSRLRVRARRVLLSEVLSRLEQVTRRRIDARSVSPRMVTIKPLDNVTCDEALAALLPAAGCAARVTGRTVHVMSLADAREARRREESRHGSSNLEVQHAVSPREVMVDLVMVSAEAEGLTEQGLGGFVDLQMGEVGPAMGTRGVLDQPVDEFLSRLSETMPMRVLSRSRLTLIDREVAHVTAGQRLRGRLGPQALVGDTTVDLSARLSIRADVLSEGRVALELRPVHRTIVSGETSDGDSRDELNAPVRMVVPSGRTVVLGGIFDEALLATSTPAFSATAFAGNVMRRELILLVTPRVTTSSASENSVGSAARGSAR